jgi:hypothetical protein
MSYLIERTYGPHAGKPPKGQWYTVSRCNTIRGLKRRLREVRRENADGTHSRQFELRVRSTVELSPGTVERLWVEGIQCLPPEGFTP